MRVSGVIGRSTRLHKKKTSGESSIARLLLHNHILIDDGVGHGERLEIEQIDVAAFCAEQ